MRFALRLVLLLLIVLVVLFAGQAFETQRLASAHAVQVAGHSPFAPATAPVPRLHWDLQGEE